MKLAGAALLLHLQDSSEHQHLVGSLTAKNVSVLKLFIDNNTKGTLTILTLSPEN